MTVQRQPNAGEIGRVVHDYLFFTEIKEQAGLEMARAVYSKVWARIGYSAVEQAKQRLRLEIAKNFEAFKRIMRTLASPTNVVAEDSETRLVAETTWCPFLEVGRTILRQPMGNPEAYGGSEWVRAAADGLLDMGRGMVLATGLEDVTVTAESHMCLGDKTCRIAFQIENRDTKRGH